MRHTLDNGLPVSGVEGAPFSYRRRQSVWGSPEHVQDITRAVNATIIGDPLASTESPRVGVRNSVAGSAVDVTSSVREGGDGHPHHQQNTIRSNASSLESPQRSSALDSLLLSALKIDPVPSYLVSLRRVHSTRAWDAIAAGAVAEARSLSETDSDVVALAASFITDGEPCQGLLVLESYVIATCVVLYEHHQGILSPYSCQERHSSVLLDWMRYRTQSLAGMHTSPPRCDVDPFQVSEWVVRYVVLQSMQLVDQVEVRRWYTLALVMCTSHKLHNDSTTRGGNHALKGSHGKGTRILSRNSDGGASAVSSPGPTSGEWRISVEEQGIRYIGTVPSTSRTGDTADAVAREVFDTPPNLWLRYFFALCEMTPGEEPLGSASPDHNFPQGRASNSDTGPSKLQATFFNASMAPVTMPGNNGGDLPGKHEKGILFCSAPSSSSNAVPVWAASALRHLDQEETATLLLSQCAEWDAFFITAVAAFHTQHYRTCMIAASRFLHWAEEKDLVRQSIQVSHRHPSLQHGFEHAGGETSASPNHRNHSSSSAPPQPVQLVVSGVPGFYDYQCRLTLFVRAWAGLQVGERLQFGKDVATLLDYAEISLSYHVGCALALYGLPLPAAKETIMNSAVQLTGAVTGSTRENVRAASVDIFTPSMQLYLYVLTESVHALMLLQMGMVVSAMGVAKTTLNRATSHLLFSNRTIDMVGDGRLLFGTLHDVVVITATALEDAASVLEVPLTPCHLTYVAMCPAFFGGLCAGGIRVRPRSDTYRVLYPSNLPLYASTRHMIPFHMSRATYLYHSGQLRSAWDDVCCAVAAADEVVGSVELAFSDCFPLRVYHFACYVGFALLEDLLSSDLEAAKMCVSNPGNKAFEEEKDATLQENEILGKEILHICQDVVGRMLHFYPHSRLTELCQVQLSIMRGDKGFLNQAVDVSNRYPHSPAAQNLLTMAIYFDNHVPEAVDSAVKNRQTFPHSSEVIRIHQMLQKKNVVYRFNYRGVLPTRYKPASTERVASKRLVFIGFLLLANLVVLGLTAYANTPYAMNLPEGMKQVAVRVQLPSVVPLVFASIFMVHAVVAATTTQNLISTTLSDLFFVNSALNRALFCLRCIPFVNLVNALLVSVASNNFLFEQGYATFTLYAVLSILFIPFTTRIWFLPSVDEPDVGVMSWLAILAVDVVTAFLVAVPHILLAVLEPFMFIVFHAPTPRPNSETTEHPPSSSVHRRLLHHSLYVHMMPPRFHVGSGSRFIYIRLLKCLYYRSISSMETRHLAESQLEAEGYRVFPMIEGKEACAVLSHLPQAPMCAALTSIELQPPSHTSAPRNDTAGIRNNSDKSKAGHSASNAGDRVDSEKTEPSVTEGTCISRISALPDEMPSPIGPLRSCAMQREGGQGGQESQQQRQHSGLTASQPTWGHGNDGDGASVSDFRTVAALRLYLSRVGSSARLLRQRAPSLASLTGSLARGNLDGEMDDE